jgi:hypothetical protein
MQKTNRQLAGLSQLWQVELAAANVHSLRRLWDESWVVAVKQRAKVTREPLDPEDTLTKMRTF